MRQVDLELSGRPEWQTKCRWGRFKGKWVVVGPSSSVRTGRVVTTWNKARQEYTEVYIQRDFPHPNDANLRYGIPGVMPTSALVERSQVPKTLEEWRVAQREKA